METSGVSSRNKFPDSGFLKQGRFLISPECSFLLCFILRGAHRPLGRVWTVMGIWTFSIFLDDYVVACSNFPTASELSVVSSSRSHFPGTVQISAVQLIFCSLDFILDFKTESRIRYHRAAKISLSTPSI